MQNLTRHLKEAIAINTERMPRYGAVSNGETIPFSKELIRYEKIALLGSWFFDRKGDALQAQGIPYLKAEFVEMSTVPAFSSTYPENVDYTRAINIINFQSYTKDLKQQFDKNNYSAIVTSSQYLLSALAQQEHVYCMTRHLVESIARIAFLIPLHQEKCDALNITSPTNYSVILLKSHYWLIERAAQFDEAVALIQNKGIPFLYQDLPSIEIEGSYDGD